MDYTVDSGSAVGSVNVVIVVLRVTSTVNRRSHENDENLTNNVRYLRNTVQDTTKVTIIR